MIDPQIELTVHVGGPLPLQMRCDPDQADDWRDVLTRLGLEVAHSRELRKLILSQKELYDETAPEEQ